jgi:hypothetical protein
VRSSNYTHDRARCNIGKTKSIDDNGGISDPIRVPPNKFRKQGTKLGTTNTSRIKLSRKEI